MGTEQRPYIGTWNIQEKKVVQHTPDCLVYINGDLTIPSVDTKGRQYRLDLQKFITGVQVDCANTPSGATASVTLSIPTHSNEPIARDANHILRVGLEVHIYMRGYFPVRGLFRGSGDNVTVYDNQGKRRSRNISEDEIVGTKLTNDDFETTTEEVEGIEYPLEVGDLIIPDWVKDKAKGVNNNNPKSMTLDELNKWAEEMGISVDLLIMAITLESESSPGKPDAPLIISSMLNRLAYNSQTGHYADNIWGIVTQPSGRVTYTGKQSESASGGRAYSTKQWYTLVNYDGRDGNGLTAALNKIHETMENRKNGSAIYGNTHFFHYGSQLSLHNKEKGQLERGEITRIKHKHPSAVHNSWTRRLNFIEQPLDNNIRIYGKRDLDLDAIDYQAQYDDILNSTKPFTYSSLKLEGTNQGRYVGTGDNYKPKTRYDDLFAYPYYHVFHGVVTNVSFSYSPGVQTATLQCGSMLHFWSYQNMSTNAAAFGTRPSNSKNRMSLMGHNFTGQHPYEIIYTLFHDTAGAAGAVNFVLDQKTNIDSVLEENSLFSLNIKYWEQRFSQRVMNLRLHGATGAMYNTLQATAMAKMTTSQIQSAFDNRSPRVGGQARGVSFLKSMEALSLVSHRTQATQQTAQANTAQAQANANAQGQQPSQAQLDQASLGNTGGFKGGKPMDLNVFMMQAFVKDIGQIASINLFESSYETKMDIANKVCEVTGFEFYQDVDGDCVFKPPMYNLDTSSSRVFRIEDIDIISFSESEKEPEVTYMITKGSQFTNLAGTGVDGEWGVQGTFIDYPLVAKYGWRSGSFETSYFNDARQCFFACINRMAVMNASVNSGNCTIPIRPEMRPGYPIYIPTYDCFYYCTSVSHSYQVGGACQTTLQLVAKRKKFYAPGDPNKSGIESIRLGGFSFPPKPLQVLDKGGYSNLSGFPNVVMTLDPDLINPMFFVSGADFESLTNEENLVNLLKLLAQTSIEGNVFKFDEKNNTFSWKQGNKTKYFAIKTTGESIYKTGSGSASNPYNLFKLAGDRDQKIRLSDKESAYNTKIARQQAVISAKGDAIKRIIDEKGKIGPGNPKGDKEQKAAHEKQKNLDATLSKLESQKDREQARLEQMLANPPKTSNNKVFTASAKGLDYLIEMLNLVRKYGKPDSNRFSKDWRDLESSANLLDLIGNKKANLSNGQIPGSYRYYSSAHPDPNEQGRAIEYQNSGTNNQLAIPKGANAPLPAVKNSRQYVFTPQITVPDALYQIPESEIKENQSVFNGIPCISPLGGTENVPTDEIFSLRFQRVEGKVKSREWKQIESYQKGMHTKEGFFKGLLGLIDRGVIVSEFHQLSQDVRIKGSDGFPDAGDVPIDYKYRALSAGMGGNVSCERDTKLKFIIENLIFKPINAHIKSKMNDEVDGFKLNSLSDLVGDLSMIVEGTHAFFDPEYVDSSITGMIWVPLKLNEDESVKQFGDDAFLFLGDAEQGNLPMSALNNNSLFYSLQDTTYVGGFYDLDQARISSFTARIQKGEGNGSSPSNPSTKDLVFFGNENPPPNYRPTLVNTTEEGKSDKTGHKGNYGNAKRFLIYSNPNAYFNPYGDKYGSTDDLLDVYFEMRGWKANGYVALQHPELIHQYDATDIFVKFGKICFACDGEFYKHHAISTQEYQARTGQHNPFAASEVDSRTDYLHDVFLRVIKAIAYQYFEYFNGVEQMITYGETPSSKRSYKRRMKKINKYALEAFGASAQNFQTRMGNVWVWKDITTEVPVFPISDNNGYEVFGHYPYGRGLDIFSNNPLDTILKTDPFIAVDRKTVENYVLSLQGKAVTITDENGQTNTFQGDKAFDEATKQLEIALKNEYSPQELLDYGLASLNADDRLQINVQNWLADTKRDGVQKLTVENRAFSIADLGFLSDLASLPSDLRSAQSDVLLPAYSSNFADIIMGSPSNNSATLLGQLLATTNSGEPKTRDMVHTIINQEGRSPNWSASQSALRGQTMETRNSADIIKDAIDNVSENFTRNIEQGLDSINRATDNYEEAQSAFDNLFIDESSLNEGNRTVEGDPDEEI